MQKPILQVKNISKKFPGILALDDVSVDFYPGEVHALIGENGAGKSTLSKVISGAMIPDAGEIHIDGTLVKIKNPLEALKYGIVSAHQELMLVPWLNVAQNIFLNQEPLLWPNLPFVDHQKMHEESRKLLASLDMSFDTKTPVKYLSTAQQQIVEICKLLNHKSRLIILDEPTASLSEREVKSLFKRVKMLCDQGLAIIYISHRMQELREIGHKVSVLRDGKLIATGKMGDYNNNDLVQMMVGRGISQMFPRNRQKPKEKVLEIKDLCVKNGPQKINLELSKGEIVGLAGLVGSGRTELMRAVFGIDQIESGEIYLYGNKVVPKSPYQMINQGIGFIPEDRKVFGLAVKLSVMWNSMMVSIRQRFRLFYKKSALIEKTEEYVRDLNVSTPTIKKTVKELSGGNQQKIVLAKWLDSNPKILVCDEPTRGIDVGAKSEVHNLLDKLVNDDMAIIMISSELPEVLGMSDRIYVMRQGKIVGHFTHDEATEDNVGALMLGLEGSENDNC